MAHAHKKNLPEDQDRLNPLHDRACQYLAAEGRKRLRRFATEWVDPPADLVCIQEPVWGTDNKRRMRWEAGDGRLWVRREKRVESEKSKAARSEWDQARESIRSPAWEEYQRFQKSYSGPPTDHYDKFRAVVAEWEKNTPKPDMEYDWVHDEEWDKSHSHLVPNKIVTACEKEIFPAVRNYRSGADEPGATIKGYLDVWIEFDEGPLAIEVKSAPVPTSEILRQILFYRNAFVSHSSGWKNMTESVMCLVTLYPLQASDLGMIMDRDIHHLELSPEVVDAWWSEKNGTIKNPP